MLGAQLKTVFCSIQLSIVPFQLKTNHLCQDIRVEKLVEYVLFDFNAIIGTVGGSLGLFLGLSFADLTIRIFSGAAKWIAQRCKNSREANSAQRIKCGLSNKGDH